MGDTAPSINDSEARPSGPGFSLAPGAGSGIGGALGWANYLGMSWTWCIGMFLPVLLVRDYGVSAWWIFAVPNVVGAAAMGWMVRSADRSREFVERHTHAATLFSLVTIAFHVFFVLWVGKLLLPTTNMLWIAVPIAVLCALLGRTRAITWIALLVLLGSLAMLLIGFQRSEIPYVNTHGHVSAIDAGALALVCCFGFGLCPYLDLTFHRAYQQTRRPRMSFSVGFGIFFFSMILFTLFYSGWMDQIIANRARPGIVLSILGWHILVQSAFTVGIHAREVLPRVNWWLLAIFAFCLIAPFVPRWVFVRSWGYGLEEPIYRIFMGFYGLVFPAYMWICVLPGQATRTPSQRELITFAIAVVAAAPFFGLGFLGGGLFWLLPGLAIVLLARWFTRVSARSRSVSSPDTTAPRAPELSQT